MIVDPLLSMYNFQTKSIEQAGPLEWLDSHTEVMCIHFTYLLLVPMSEQNNPLKRNNFGPTTLCKGKNKTSFTCDAQPHAEVGINTFCGKIDAYVCK